MEEYLKRVRDELTELAEKALKLEFFIVSEKFGKLPREERLHLVVQLGAMNTYGTILNLRLSNKEIL